MAIQFKCPGCSAMIRVPDTSAGKKGTCPQCSEKLIVPTVVPGKPATMVPQATVAPSASASPVSERPHLGSPHIDVTAPSAGGKSPFPPTTGTNKTHPPKLDPLATGLPKLGTLEETPPATSTLGLPTLEDDVSSSFSRKMRQKKQTSPLAWMIPLVCVAILVGVVGWFMWKGQPKLEGNLLANVVHGLEIKPILIPDTASGLSESELKDLMQQLKGKAIEWNSNSLKIVMTGTGTGVEVSLRPGRNYHFVAVPISKDRALVDYIKKHSGDLDKPRLAAIQKQAPKFFAAWKTHFAKHAEVTDQPAHRDGLIVPLFVTGVGYHVEAAVGEKRYACVYEGTEGLLYFLLPNATKSFYLVGQNVADGATFPVNFKVTIEGEIEAPDSSTSSKQKAKSKTPEEREAENQGMNPDLELEPDGMSDDESETNDLNKGRGNGMAAGNRSSNAKSKSARQMKMDMMDDEEMPDDSMPGKPKSKSKSAMKEEMMDGNMTEDEDEMMEKPKMKSGKKPMPLKGDMKEGMMNDEMMDDQEEMMEKPKPKPKKK